MTFGENLIEDINTNPAYTTPWNVSNPNPDAAAAAAAIGGIGPDGMTPQQQALFNELQSYNTNRNLEIKKDVTTSADEALGKMKGDTGMAGETPGADASMFSLPYGDTPEGLQLWADEAPEEFDAWADSQGMNFLSKSRLSPSYQVAVQNMLSKLPQDDYSIFLNTTLSGYQSMIDDINGLINTQAFQVTKATQDTINSLTQRQILYQSEKEASIARNMESTMYLRDINEQMKDNSLKESELANDEAQYEYDRKIAKMRDNNSRLLGFLKGKFEAAGMADSSAGLELMGKYMASAEEEVLAMEHLKQNGQETFLLNNRKIQTQYFSNAFEIESKARENEASINSTLDNQIAELEQQKTTSRNAKDTQILALIKEAQTNNNNYFKESSNLILGAVKDNQQRIWDAQVDAIKSAGGIVEIGADGKPTYKLTKNGQMALSFENAITMYDNTGVWQPSEGLYDAMVIEGNGLESGAITYNVPTGTVLDRGECGQFVNDALFGEAGHFGDTLEQKMTYDNTSTPVAGGAFIEDVGDNVGHVGCIEKVYPDGSFDTVESNYTADNTVSRDHISPDNPRWNKIVGLYNPALDKENYSSATDSQRAVIDSGFTQKQLSEYGAYMKSGKLPDYSKLPKFQQKSALNNFYLNYENFRNRVLDGDITLEQYDPALFRSEKAKLLSNDSYIAMKSYSELQNSIKTYYDLVKKAGSVAWAEDNKATIKGAYADLKIKWKEAANLGALTGPDIGLIEEAIPNILSVWAPLRKIKWGDATTEILDAIQSSSDIISRNAGRDLTAIENAFPDFENHPLITQLKGETTFKVLDIKSVENIAKQKGINYDFDAARKAGLTDEQIRDYLIIMSIYPAKFDLTQSPVTAEQFDKPKLNVWQRAAQGRETALQEGVSTFKEGAGQFVSSGMKGDWRGMAEGAMKGIRGITKGTAGQLVYGAMGAAEPIMSGVTKIGEGMGDVTKETLSAVTPDVIETPAKQKLYDWVQSAKKGVSENISEETKSLIKETGMTAWEMLDWLMVSDLIPKGPKMATKATTATMEHLTKTPETLIKTGEAIKESGVASSAANRTAYVRKLVQPEQTSKVKEAQVSRTTEKGVGPLKRSEVKPFPEDLRAEKYVSEIPEVKDGNTYQQNWNIINNENIREAETLRANLKANDAAYDKATLTEYLDNARNILADDITITGDAEKIAVKMTDYVAQLIEKSNGQLSDVLTIRQKFDRWVESQKPKAFDATVENAIGKANRAVRNSLNDFLKENATSVDVAASLEKQSALFHALDNITPKAAKEADSAILRLLDKTGEILQTKSRIVQGVAAAAGIGGLGAAATFAPIVAVLGGMGVLTYYGGKMVMNPMLRIKLGEAVMEIGRLMETTKDPVKLKNMKAVQDEINSFRIKYGKSSEAAPKKTGIQQEPGIPYLDELKPEAEPIKPPTEHSYGGMYEDFKQAEPTALQRPEPLNYNPNDLRGENVNKHTSSVDKNFIKDQYTEELSRLQNQMARNPKKTPAQIKLWNELNKKVEALKAKRK
jgi:surface antigen